MKPSWKMKFGKKISRLVSRYEKKKTNSTTNNMLTNEVTINLNMLGAIMKNIIVSNHNGTTIVTMKNSST